MDKNKSTVPETEYAKFQRMIAQYEKILHPDIFRPLMTQLHLCYEESKKEAYETAQISDEALYIERRMLELKKSQGFNSAESTFFIKCLYKEFLRMFLGGQVKSPDKLFN